MYENNIIDDLNNKKIIKNITINYFIGKNDIYEDTLMFNDLFFEFQFEQSKKIQWIFIQFGQSFLFYLNFFENLQNYDVKI